MSNRGAKLGAANDDSHRARNTKLLRDLRAPEAWS
jgi:hypothetical protein